MKDNKYLITGKYVDPPKIGWNHRESERDPPTDRREVRKEQNIGRKKETKEQHRRETETKEQHRRETEISAQIFGFLFISLMFKNAGSVDILMSISGK